MTEVIKLTAPLSRGDIEGLTSGDVAELSGIVYTARDAAHRRMIDALGRGEELPFPIEGAVIYYCGPSPAPPGRPIGAAGPTTSGRMDAYAPGLIGLGLGGMIGKGNRSAEVIAACRERGSVYFGAIGGAGALMSECVLSAEVIAWEDLGPEAVRRLEVRDMPLVVINDMHGGDLYDLGIKMYAKR